MRYRMLVLAKKIVSEMKDFYQVNEPIKVEKSDIETIEWLIEQTEKAEKYREALEFYANKETYESVLISESQYDADGVCISNDEYLTPIIYLDEGETARKVLESE